MPLKLRPNGLGHGVYKDIPDYSGFCGEWFVSAASMRTERPGGDRGTQAGALNGIKRRLPVLFDTLWCPIGTGNPRSERL
jgi:hypothetical protein